MTSAHSSAPLSINLQHSRISIICVPIPVLEIELTYVLLVLVYDKSELRLICNETIVTLQPSNDRDSAHSSTPHHRSFKS
jgi:hypothetical protein